MGWGKASVSSYRRFIWNSNNGMFSQGLTKAGWHCVSLGLDFSFKEPAIEPQ
jgi:hypothetical protein